MNWLNHFLMAFILLFTIFNKIAPLNEIIIFAVVFGLFLDLDHLLNLRKKEFYLRTWLQEPVGFLLIGIPLGIILSNIKSYYFFFVTIPFASHILLDYLAMHQVSPLDPISKKVMKIGFITKSVALNDNKKGLFSENYITIILTIILVVFLSTIP